MFQRHKLFIDLLALYLNRQKGMALLERIQASSLSDEDRDRVSPILRVMLRLPDDDEPELSPPQAALPNRPTALGQATRLCQSASASHRRR